MIKLISTEVLPKINSNQEENFYTVLDGIDSRMRILATRNGALTYRIKPNLEKKIIQIVTLDLQEYVN